MSEFAIVCRDATVVIAPAINITVAVLVTAAIIVPIYFGFRIAISSPLHQTALSVSTSALQSDEGRRSNAASTPMV
jgi:hypothetical protein